MTETLVGLSPLRKAAKKTLTPEEVERNAVRELVAAASARGDDLTGPEGLLKSITKQVIEAALEEEMTEHVGYDKHAAEGRNGGNSRIGTRSKTVLTANEALREGVPNALVEFRRHGRTLNQRTNDILAHFDRPGTSNGSTEALNGRLKHLRGSALGFCNLTNYIAGSLLETGGFRPALDPRL